jgi:hypothetical protein
MYNKNVGNEIAEKYFTLYKVYNVQYSIHCKKYKFSYKAQARFFHTVACSNVYLAGRKGAEVTRK